MKKDDKKRKPNFEKDTFFVASTNDCTGLMPTLPLSNEELEAYNDIYQIYPETEED